jgi:hypothetical protein
LEVRDAAAKILESTSVADIVGGGGGSGSRKRAGKKKKTKKAPLLSIVDTNSDVKSK